MNKVTILEAGDSAVMHVLPGHTLTVTNDGWTLTAKASKAISIKPVDSQTVVICESGEVTDDEMP